MPIYTYHCDNCGVQFDRQQHFDDPIFKKCPECGKLKLRKVFLPVGIVFKGSGFYATDHRSPSGQVSSRSDGSSESTSESSGDSSKTSKSEESSSKDED
jgi:putative FmdB family regulatory protein